MSDFIEKFGAILLAVIFLGVIATFVGTNTSFFTAEETASLQAVPFNITLTEDDAQSIINVSNGTFELPLTTNYTVDLDAGFVTIVDNTSWTGTVTVDYEYRQGTYIRPAIAVIIAALILIAAVGIILVASKGLRKKGR